MYFHFATENSRKASAHPDQIMPDNVSLFLLENVIFISNSAHMDVHLYQEKPWKFMTSAE